MSDTSEAGSGIEGMRPDSAFARRVAEGLREPFRLIDVGAAGGIAGGWRVFGERLAALAYEADPAEVARLNGAEANPAVRYHAGLVGLPPEHPLRVRLGERAHQHAWVGGRLSFERMRIIKATRDAGDAPLPVDRHFSEVVAKTRPAPPADGYDTDYAATFAAEPGTLPALTAAAGETPLIYLPEHLRQEGFEDADFLKIDVDGPDFEILRSCEALLSRPGLLGVALEVSFFGSHDANDNSFHNMDRLMRRKGFSLFGLSVRKYSSAALPSPFMDRHPGPTYQGRPFQGDAIYMRDLASGFWMDEAAAVSDDKLLKLCALFSLFELADQAAEVLLAHGDRLAGRLDIPDALDRLTQEAQESWPEGVSFRDWIRKFEESDPFFFDIYGARNRWLARLIQTRDEAPVREKALQETLAAAEIARDEADGRATQAEAAAQAATDALRAHEAQAKHLIDSEITLRAIRASTLWRALAPLRALGSLLRR